MQLSAADLKVNDWVKRPHWPNFYKIEKIVGTTIYLKSDMGTVHDYSGVTDWEKKFTHVPLYSEEQAVAFLKEKGYSVQAPPEPLKGKIVIIKSATGLIFGYSPEQKLASSATVLAIVDWTEGQGLEKPTESNEAIKASSEASEPDGSF